jgi:hypothetical protein
MKDYKGPRATVSLCVKMPLFPGKKWKEQRGAMGQKGSKEKLSKHDLDFLKGMLLIAFKPYLTHVQFDNRAMTYFGQKSSSVHTFLTFCPQYKTLRFRDASYYLFFRLAWNII